MAVQAQQPANKRFDRGAALTLAFVILLLFASISALVYHFTLPVDGWISVEPDDPNSFGYIYGQNVLGVPSGLQAGDHLIAVEGISLDRNELDPALFSLSSLWQAGNRIHYTVIRQGQQVELMVPLVDFWQERKNLPMDANTTNNLVGIAGVLIFLGMGFFTFFKQPENMAARAILVLSATWLSAFILSGFSALPGPIQDRIFPGSIIPEVLLFSAAFTVLIPPAFIRLGLVFPHPKPILQRYPWIEYLPYGIGGIGMIAFLNGIYLFGWVWMAISVLVTILLLVHNAITMRDAVSRAQMGWGLGGMLLGLAVFFTTYIPVFLPVSPAVEAFFNALSSLSFNILGLALTIAILRYNLFDIEVIVRRTLQYGVLTFLLGLVYFGGVTLLQSVFTAITGQQSPLAVVLSTLVVAALFGAVRRWVQAFIDRRFYRQKYNADQAVASFSAAARSEFEVEALSIQLASAVKESLQPESVTLWLKDQEGKR